MRLTVFGVLALTLIGCSEPVIDDFSWMVREIRVEYVSGSVGPPHAYSYEVHAVDDDDDGIEVSYSLTYEGREGISGEELAAQGYSSDDDIAWTTVLTDDDRVAWLSAARELSPEPEVAGIDTYVGAEVTVTVTYLDGDTVSETLRDFETWKALVMELDRQARDALGHHRQAP